MRIRVIFTLPVVVLATFLHLGCCLLPLLSIASTTLPYFDFIFKYKAIFFLCQIFISLYLGTRIILDLIGLRPFCSVRNRVIHFLSVTITIAGLAINYYEPFKSENQQLAEQQFLRFKSHRQMDIKIASDFDQEKLHRDLVEMSGVKANRIRMGDGVVALTFQNDKTSREEILRKLRSKGYVVSD